MSRVFTTTAFSYKQISRTPNTESLSSQTYPDTPRKRTFRQTLPGELVNHMQHLEIAHIMRSSHRANNTLHAPDAGGPKWMLMDLRTDYQEIFGPLRCLDYRDFREP